MPVLCSRVSELSYIEYKPASDASNDGSDGRLSVQLIEKRVVVVVVKGAEEEEGLAGNGTRARFATAKASQRLHQYSAGTTL